MNEPIENTVANGLQRAKKFTHDLREQIQQGKITLDEVESELSAIESLLSDLALLADLVPNHNGKILVDKENGCVTSTPDNGK